MGGENGEYVFDLYDPDRDGPVRITRRLKHRQLEISYPGISFGSEYETSDFHENWNRLQGRWLLDREGTLRAAAKQEYGFRITEDFSAASQLDIDLWNDRIVFEPEDAARSFVFWPAVYYGEEYCLGREDGPDCGIFFTTHGDEAMDMMRIWYKRR